jgi:hypothetical protein
LRIYRPSLALSLLYNAQADASRREKSTRSCHFYDELLVSVFLDQK